MDKVLIGTTNPSKVKLFQELLSDYAVEFLTLKDLHIAAEPEETGTTPQENAELKAKFYGQYFDLVVCNDSGLYFDLLPLNDPRQPGLHIRTPQGKRLDDEQMIDYYTALVHSLGGKLLAYYLDGVAVYRRGEVFSFMDTPEAAADQAFYMVDSPAKQRHPGWPLDSLSLNRETQRYFVQGISPQPKGNERCCKRWTGFLAQTLQLKKIERK